jgi:hypothetical protein
MVEMYLAARLHNRISTDEYRAVLLEQNLDEQEQKLKTTLLRLVETGSVRLA